MRIGMLCSLLALLILASPAGAQTSSTGNDATRVSMTNPLPGDTAPDFTLMDANGNSYTLSDYTDAGNVVVLEWFNPQCPAVAKYRANSNFMNDTAAAFESQPVVWLAIDSSAPGTASASPAEINAFATTHGMTAPVLLDSAGDVGRNYGVSATPTILVIAPDRTVAYSGAPDESMAQDSMPAGDNYIKEAVSAALSGLEPPTTATAVRGCAIPFSTEVTRTY